MVILDVGISVDFTDIISVISALISAILVSKVFTGYKCIHLQGCVQEAVWDYVQVVSNNLFEENILGGETCDQW